MKAHFDNVIESGRVRSDLEPPSEMAAVSALLKARDEGKLEIWTSQEAHREQDRTSDSAVRALLANSRGETPVVPNDHKLFGIHNQMNHLGTVANCPILTEIVDEASVVAQDRHTEKAISISRRLVELGLKAKAK